MIFFIMITILLCGVVYRRAGKEFRIIDSLVISLSAVFNTVGLSYLMYFKKNSFVVESVYSKFALGVIVITAIISVVLSLRLVLKSRNNCFPLLLISWFVMSNVLVKIEKIVSPLIGYELDVKTVTFTDGHPDTVPGKELWIAGNNYGELPVEVELDKLIELSQESTNKSFSGYTWVNLPNLKFQFSRENLIRRSLSSAIDLSNLEIPVMLKVEGINLTMTPSKWSYKMKHSHAYPPLPLDIRASALSINIGSGNSLTGLDQMKKLITWARLHDYKLNSTWLSAMSKAGYATYDWLSNVYLKEGEFDKLLLPVICYREDIPEHIDEEAAYKIYEKVMAEVNMSEQMMPVRDCNIVRRIFQKLDRDALLQKAIADIESKRFDPQLTNSLKEVQTYTYPSDKYNDSVITILALKYWHEFLVKTGQSDYIGRTIFSHLLRNGEKFYYYRELFPDISAEYVLAKFKAKGDRWADGIDHVTLELKAVLDFTSPATDKFVHEHRLQIIQILNLPSSRNAYNEWRNIANRRPEFFNQNWKLSFVDIQDGKTALNRRLYNLPYDVISAEMVKYIFTQFSHESILQELSNMNNAQMEQKLCTALKAEIEQELSKDNRFRDYYENVMNGRNLIYEKISKLPDSDPALALNELETYSSSEDVNIRNQAKSAHIKLNEIKELDLNKFDMIKEIYSPRR